MLEDDAAVNVGQLEAFVVLSEELHFGRAARRLQASTPNLSKRLADLERELEVRLFERTSRQVRLTPAGALLVDPARRALTELEHFRAIAENAARGRAGVVRIAYAPGTGQVVAQLTHRLRASSDLQVDVVLEPLISLQVIEAVRSGRATIGVCRDGSGPGLSRLVVLRSPRNMVAMPVHHRLASKPALTSADFEGETFLHPDASVTSLSESADVLRRLGARIEIRFERFETETEVMDRVAAGFGVSLISAAFGERNPRPDVVVRQLTDLPSEPLEEFDLIWRSADRSALISFVIEQARPLAR